MAHYLRRLGTIAALAGGLALPSCAYADWGEVSGVSLAELDTAGTPPSSIELAGPDRVVISQGDDFSVSVEGSREAGEALRFERDGDSLTIARDSDVYDGSGTAIVQLRIPAPSDLEIAGSGTIEAETMAREANIEVAGSGSIEVDRVTAERLDVEIAGSGDVQASGTVRVLSVEIAGSGDVNLAGLQADDVKVDIAGSGDVEVRSDGTVNADIAGSGDVVVVGSARCSSSSAGSGTLSCTQRSAAAGSSGSANASE